MSKKKNQKGLNMKKGKMYVLLDFSVYSIIELRLAKKWTEWHDIEVVVVHQLVPQIPSMADPDVRLNLIYDQKRDVSRLWFDLQEKVFGGESFHKFEITTEPLTQYLKGIIEPEDMILMGLKGSGKLKQIFLGSQVKNIVEDLDQITIAVPKSLENFEPTKLVVSVHPRFPLNQNAFNLFIQNIPKSIRTVQFLTVASPQDDKEDLDTFLQNLSKIILADLSIETSLFSGNDVFEEIKNHFKGKHDYFLLVQQGSRDFSDRLFRKFLVNDLVFDGSIPMVILP
jgi:hypothetical protein